MKKLLVALLTLVLCVSAFTACVLQDPNAPQETTPNVSYNPEAAAAYVFNLYKDKSVTAADFDVTAVANVAGVSYTVEWSVDTDKVTITKKNDTTYTVNVDEESAEELAYVLTATIKAGDGSTATKSFNLTVPKYVLTSFEEYMAAKADDNVVVKGIVVAINSKSAGNKYNHLFLADLEGKGGYYCYSMAKDPIADDGIELGMIVEVSGPVAPYSGMQEIKGGTARIIDSNKHDVTPVDVTEKFANGDSLANYVGMPVTIKGVEIKGQALEKDTDQYLNFVLNGKTSYIRTYVSDFPTTLGVTNNNGTYSSPNKAVIDEAHAAKFGWLANATGILVLYNSNPYLIPMNVDCFEYIEKIVKTPEQMVAEALEALTIPTFISENTTLELPATSAIHAGVTFSWTVDKEGYTITDNKIALTVSETAVELKFTATATCEGKTGTKEITVKVALPEMSIDEALKLDDGATVVLVGVVTEIKTAYSEQYGNISVTLKDATGELYLFRLTGNVAVGDVIKVTGKMGSYNGAKQLAAGGTFEKLTVSTSAEATAAADGTNVILVGKVTQINTEWSEQFGNITVTIADEAGTFYLFRLKANVKVGDELVVFGKVGSYNGSKQLAAGGTAIITKAAAEEGGNEGGNEGGETPTFTSKLEIVDAPVAGTEYYFGLAQVNKETDLYITGAMSGFYYATTSDKAAAAKVVLEAVAGKDGVYYLSTTVSGAKKYLNIVKAMGTDGKEHINVVFEDAAVSEYVYNTEYKTVTTNVGEDTYYFGTYGTYTTFSASKIDKAATSFVAHFCVASATPSTPDQGGDNTGAEFELPYTYTFSEKVFSANETKTLNGLDWTLAGENGNYWGYQNGKGQQLGSKNNPYTTMTLTSAAVNGITKIVINSSGASGIEGTFTVSVGGTQIGEAQALTTTATDYTFESATALSGEVVITYTLTVGKAIYVQTISLNP